MLDGAPRIRTGVVICCLSTFLVNLDNTVVNLALPDLSRELHPGIAGLQWVVDAYLLVLSSLVICSGSLGDRLGRKLVFETGLALFALGSLLSALAPNVGWLIAFRVLQAIGGSMLNPTAMSLISNMVTSAEERARSFAAWGIAVGVGMASGPLFGGPLVEYFGWRSIFWVNVPIVALIMVMVHLHVPESKAEQTRRFDPVGQILVLGVIALTVFTIIELPHSNSAAKVAAEVLTVCAAAVVFVVYESNRTDPLIDIRFFKSVPFSMASAIAVFNYAAIGGFLFLNTIHLQEALGFSALKAGLATVPMAVSTAVSAQLAGNLMARRGQVFPLVISGAAITTGALLSMCSAHTKSLPLILLCFVVFGVGFGGANTPVNTIAMAGMPKAQAGVAGAIASSSRQLGQSLGVAMCGALLASALGGRSPATDFESSSAGAWLLIAFCGIAVVLCGLCSATDVAKRSAQQAARQIEKLSQVEKPGQIEQKGATARAA